MEEVILSVEKCDCIGEPGCECQPFKLRKGELNRVKFLYFMGVGLLTMVALVVSISSIVNLPWLNFLSMFIILGLFIGAYVIASKVPKSFRDIVCTEFGAFHRDVGMLRWRRTFILIFDITIASFGLMIFVWDMTHNVWSIMNGVQANDQVPLMYLWSVPEWEWNLLKQGWLDFFFALVTGMFIVLEISIWLDKRLGDMCSLGLDDVPILVIGEHRERVESIEGDYWMDGLTATFKQFFPEDESI